MRAFFHRRIEFELKAGGIGELQRAALERLLDEGVSDAVLGKERRRLVEIAVIADLEAEPAAGRDRGLPQHQRVMLMLLAAAQIDRKSTRLNSSHRCISYAVFCLKKKK